MVVEEEEVVEATEPTTLIVFRMSCSSIYSGTVMQRSWAIRVDILAEGVRGGQGDVPR